MVAMNALCRHTEQTKFRLIEYTDSAAEYPTGVWYGNTDGNTRLCWSTEHAMSCHMYTTAVYML